MSAVKEEYLSLFIKASIREMELKSVVDKLSNELESVKEEKAKLYSKYLENNSNAVRKDY